MTGPIKISWFCHPVLSWFLVYLVKGGSQLNLAEGTLSAAIGYFVQEYLVNLGWMLRKFSPDLRSYTFQGSFNGIKFRVDGGGIDDGPDQDPMVPSSQVIMVSGLLNQRSVIGEHTSDGHNHNVVVSFGSKPPARGHVSRPYWQEII
ncbi:hypothetical protein M5K25_009511 [Dendrobium thyrsiflorum]|uniref:Uncharacterized protein n=1 Tax=Dendrobium thyrsiflorum TaxID=117978 RepID=A0ABD0V5N0_DENTH